MASPTDNSTAAKRAKSALFAGLLAIIAGISLLALPLLLGRWELNKYLVVAGFISACWGVCCLLLGGLEWLSARRR